MAVTHGQLQIPKVEGLPPVKRILYFVIVLLDPMVDSGHASNADNIDYIHYRVMLAMRACLGFMPVPRGKIQDSRRHLL
jgi:hypothetical protein